MSQIKPCQKCGNPEGKFTVFTTKYKDKVYESLKPHCNKCEYERIAQSSKERRILTARKKVIFNQATK
jgi:hypothetical protein